MPRSSRRSTLTGLLATTPLFLAPTASALDIEEITMFAGPARLANAPIGPDPYFLSIEVDGTGIAAITVSTSEVTDFPMTPDPDGFFFIEEFDYTDLVDMDNEVGFGSFTFDIQGTLGEVDSVTVSFDPGTVDPIGYPMITTPTNGAVDVAPDATLGWSCTGGPCGAGNVEFFHVALYQIPEEELLDEDLLADPDATAWSHPGSVILANTVHEFEIEAIQTIAFQQPISTMGDDDLEFSSGYLSANSVFFTPEPGLGLGLVGGVLLLASRRRGRIA